MSTPLAATIDHPAALRDAAHDWSSRDGAEEHDGWFRDCLAVGRAYHWSRGPAWRHNAVNAAFLATEILLIALTVRAVALLPALAGVTLGGLALGVLYFLLLAIGVHEASHGMFFIARDHARRRKLNRAIGWALSLPFGIHYSRHWEVGHLMHHARPLEPDDPQRFNIDTGRSLLRTVVLMTLVPGYAFMHRYVSGRVRSPGRTSRAVLATFVGSWCVLGAALTLAGLGRVALALVMGLQVASAINQIKGALEHGGDVGLAEDFRLRSRSILSRVGALLVPFHVTVFHFEHHLADQVPWYRLGAFHRALGGLVPVALHREQYRRDPLGVLAGRTP